MSKITDRLAFLKRNDPFTGPPGNDPHGSDPAVQEDNLRATKARPQPHASRVSDAVEKLSGSTPVNLESGQVKRTTGDRNWSPTLDSQQVTAAKAKLSSNDRTTFDQLDRQLSSDPSAQHQLENLLVKGDLLQKDTKGRTLLANLAKIGAGPLGHGLDSGQVLTDTLADLTDPSTINQGQTNTCTATAMASELAQCNPAEYARLIAGLSSTDGKVTLQDGKTVIDSSQYNPNETTTTEGLIAPALMGAEAQIEGGHYSTADDQIEFNDPSQNHGGAYDSDIAAVESELIGGHYKMESAHGNDHSFLFFHWGDNHNQLMDQLKSASPDHPIIASFAVKEGNHMVQVVGYDPGKDTVTIRNPWGETDLIPGNQFRQALNDITVPQ